MTQEQLANKLCYRDKSTIAKIETGKSDLPQSKIIEFAKALETTPAILMGWSLPSVLSTKTTSIKVYNKIPFGAVISELPVIEEIVVAKRMLVEDSALMALRVIDDAMYPEYLEGDTVVIKQQTTIKNGEDYAVFINNKPATIRKLYRSIDAIVIKPTNTNYPPATYPTNDIIILGKVVEIRRYK